MTQDHTPKRLTERIWRSRTFTAIAVAAGMLLLFWLFSFLNRRFLYFKVWEYLATQMVDGWQFPRDLANAIAAVVWIPFVYFLKESVIPKRQRRTIGLAGISGYLFVFFTVAYAANRDTHFGTHGKGWVSLTSEGCIYAETGGVDPTYGIQRMQVTPALVEVCERTSNGEEPCIKSLDLIPIRFNPDTQEALVWFVRNGTGDYCFYMTAGVDTGTGTRRQPLTPRDVILIQSEIDELEAAEDRSAQQAADQRRKNEQARFDSLQTQRASEERSREQARIRSELNRHVNLDLLSSLLSSPSVLVAVRSLGTRNAEFENLVADELTRNGIPARAGFLKSPGYSQVFDDLKSGDTHDFQVLNLSSATLKLLMIDATVEEARETGIGDTYKANGNVSGRLLSLNGSNIHSFSFTARGAGFHPVDARAQALSEATNEVVLQLVQR